MFLGRNSIMPRWAATAGFFLGLIFNVFACVANTIPQFILNAMRISTLKCLLRNASSILALTVCFFPPFSSLAQLLDNDPIRVATTTATYIEEPNDPNTPVQIFTGHDSVNSVAVSLDRAKVLIAGRNSGIVAILWDIETSQMLQIFKSHGDVVGLSAVFSTDGMKVLTAGSRWGDQQTWPNGEPMVCLWDAQSGERIRSYEGHLGSVWSAVFSPDGSNILSGGGRNPSSILWDTLTGKVLHELPGQSFTVAFSPDGETLFTGGPYRGTLWDPKTGSKLRELNGINDFIHSCAFSDDGTQLLTGHSPGQNPTESTAGVINLWDVSSGTRLRRLIGHEDPDNIVTRAVKSITFLLDGTRAISGGSDAQAILWDLSSGSVIRTFDCRDTLGSPHSDRTVTDLAIYPDQSQFFSSTKDGVTRRWDIDSGTVVQYYSGHVMSINAVAFTPDANTIITAGNDNVANLWDVSSGLLLKKLVGHQLKSSWQSFPFLPPGGIFSLAVSSDGRRAVTGGADKTAILWDLDTGSVLNRFTGHKDWVWSVALSQDGNKIVAGSVGEAVVWDAQSGDRLFALPHSNCYIWSVAFSPDGNSILTTDYQEGGVAVLWDVNTRKKLSVYSGHSGEIRAVAFSPNGLTIATGSDDKTARLWNIESGKEILTLTGHTGCVKTVTFNLDGSLLLTGGNETIIWNAMTGERLRRLPSGAESAAFSPNGFQALTGSGTTAKLWDISDLVLQPTPAPTPTATSVILPTTPVRTATPVNGNYTRLFSENFDRSSIADSGWEAFPVGQLDPGLVFGGAIPSSLSDPTLSDGKGLTVFCQPGQGSIVFGPGVGVGDGPTVIRSSILTSRPDVAIAVGLLNGVKDIGLSSSDGTIAVTNGLVSTEFMSDFRQISVLFDPKDAGVAPFLQIVQAKSDSDQASITYVDNVEIFRLNEVFCSGLMWGDKAIFREQFVGSVLTEGSWHVFPAGELNPATVEAGAIPLSLDTSTALPSDGKGLIVSCQSSQGSILFGPGVQTGEGPVILRVSILTTRPDVSLAVGMLNCVKDAGLASCDGSIGYTNIIISTEHITDYKTVYVFFDPKDQGVVPFIQVAQPHSGDPKGSITYINDLEILRLSDSMIEDPEVRDILGIRELPPPVPTQTSIPPTPTNSPTNTPVPRTAAPTPTPLSTKTATSTPTPTPPDVEVPPNTVVITDDLYSTGDLAGKYDQDEKTDRVLIIRWNWDKGEAEISDFHIWVLVNNSKPALYVGHTKSGQSIYFEWRRGGKFTAPAFAEGPEFGNTYLFSVFGISEGKNQGRQLGLCYT